MHAPTSGYVTAKDVYEGLYVTPEMTLYTVTDLARVWVLLDLYEPELPFVRLGTPVTLTLRSYPGETRRGTVSYIYPYLENQTRTNKVRVELDNSDFRLKPEMYANGEIRALLDEHVVVPQDAVLDSGAQQVVFVVAADGHFEPRTVRLGQRADNDVEVLDGLNDGERVVVAANFLVDSESQLKAALDAMGGSDQAPPH